MCPPRSSTTGTTGDYTIAIIGRSSIPTASADDDPDTKVFLKGSFDLQSYCLGKMSGAMMMALPRRLRGAAFAGAVRHLLWLVKQACNALCVPAIWSDIG